MPTNNNITYTVRVYLHVKVKVRSYITSTLIIIKRKTLNRDTTGLVIIAVPMYTYVGTGFTDKKCCKIRLRLLRGHGDNTERGNLCKFNLKIQTGDGRNYFKSQYRTTAYII